MKEVFKIFLAILFSNTCVFPQTITGNLSLLANQSIQLEGFNGLKTYRAVV